MPQPEVERNSMHLPEGIEDLSELAYITSRKLADEHGEKTGSVLLWRKKGDESFHYTLTCPHCGSEQASRALLTRRPYRVECYSCKKSVVIEKLAK